MFDEPTNRPVRKRSNYYGQYNNAVSSAIKLYKEQSSCFNLVQKKFPPDWEQVQHYSFIHEYVDDDKPCNALHFHTAHIMQQSYPDTYGIV